MLRAQASRPPARFFTLPKPRLRRYSATAALRTPWWQYTTISSAELSSSVLSSISSMGMCTAFSSRQSLVSQSWRTSRSTTGARSSRRALSSAGVSSLFMNSILRPRRLSRGGPLVGEEDGSLGGHLDLDLIAQAEAPAHEGRGDHLDPDRRPGNADVVELARALEHVAGHCAWNASGGEGGLLHPQRLGPETEKGARARRPGVRAGGDGQARAARRLHHHAHLTQLGHANGHEIGRAHELGDERVARLPVDLFGLPLLDEGAARHHPDAGGQGERLGLVMGDVERGDTDLAMQARELEAHAGAGLRVEPRQRLVEKQESRLDNEGARHRHALSFISRELRGPARLDAGEAHLLEGRFDLSLELGPPRAALAEPEGHVLEHAQVGPEGVVAEDHAQVALPGRHVIDGLVVHHDPPLVWRDEPREHPEQRGLAAARGTEERVELAGTDGERDIANGPPSAVALAHAFHARFRYPDHRLVLSHHIASFPPRPRRPRRATRGATSSPSAATV